MGIEQNKRIIRRLFEEALNQGKLEVLDGLFSPTFVDYSTPDQPAGPAGVKAYLADIRKRFPNLQVMIEDMIAEGSKVVVRSVWRGAQQGATADRETSRTMIQIFQLENGRIIGEWNEGDSMV
ncbi:ester cyclase [Ktedonosporobacter rubrisoli]|nr:ester cyclase [Ktedonosporobacter rubrisoli]